MVSVGTKKYSHRHELEGSISVLRQDLERYQGSHEAMQGRGVHAGREREFFARLRPTSQEIRDF